MKFHPKPFALFSMIALITAVMSLSCDLKDPDDYEVMIIIMASASTTSNQFTATLLLDNNIPFTLNSPVTASPTDPAMLIIPAGKIETATITATRTNSDATMSILIYKDNELDEKGVGLLATCNTTATTSCSNTLNLVYKVDQEDTDNTKGASASSSSDTSSED